MIAGAPTRLLVDVTQYADWPATSGVQRTLLHVARNWPEAAVDASYGFIDDGRYVTGPLDALGTIVGRVFALADEGIATPADTVRDGLRRAANDVFDPDDIESRFGGFLLPEPTLRRDNLEFAAALDTSSRTRVFYLYYDALPLTHPEYYPRGADADGSVTRYHRVVSRGDHVAFISERTRAVFEQRVARRTLPDWVVVRPGADGLPNGSKTEASRAMFVVVGTVEPRKRHDVVLDAFSRLWDAGKDYRLVVLGAAGWQRPDVLERLRSLAETPRVDWIERADDQAIADAFATATAALFVPDAEGYGLPPLEALAAGCPVIVSADLPALEGLPAGGQVRLVNVASTTVADAVEKLAEPTTNETYRRQIEALRLPTWKTFADDLSGWIASGLNVDRLHATDRTPA